MYPPASPRLSLSVNESGQVASTAYLATSLDDNVEFVCRTLELPHPKEPIPAYVFRNPEGYYDFCEQHAGFSREEARETAGHGCGRYFAVYYMRPNSAVVERTAVAAGQ